MKKIFWQLIGLFSLVITGVSLAANRLFAEEPFQGVQFDPEGKIKQATKLPDESPVNITVNVIQWALGFLGLVAVIMILWGGFTWMTAAGNEERVRKAKEVLRAAIIGLIVILLSWAIVTFIFGQTQELAS